MAEHELTPEEKQEFTIIQSEFEMITRRYGEVAYQELLIETEKRRLRTEMERLEKSRVAFLEQIKNKYGAGMIDIEKGIVTTHQ